MSIKSFLESGDPLSQEALEQLVKHREEDLYVDYKESFEPKDEQHWLNITKDAMAFSNTMKKT